jgi:hypothetical protein
MPATQESAMPIPEPKLVEGKHILYAIWHVMREVTVIPKSGQYEGGKSGNYSFRKYSDVALALGVAFRKYGVFVQSETVSSDYGTDKKPYPSGSGYVEWTSARLEMRYVFTSLVDGSELHASSFGEGKDNSDKGTGKAMTNAIKSALTQAFMIPTDDPDPDTERPGDDQGDYSRPTGQGRGPSTQGQQQRPPQNRPAGPQPPAAQPELTQAEQRHANARWFVQAMNQPNVDLARLNELIGLAKAKGLLGYEYEGVPLQVRFTAAGGLLGKQATPAATSNEFPPEPEGLY